MKSQALISVIVPVYNTSKYLDECIDSLIRQNYRNLQIILVNDGSTDDSLQICLKYKDRDNRIEVIDQQNGGLSSARNSGLKAAFGDYISFVDSDDKIHEDMLNTLYEILERYNCDIAECHISTEEPLYTAIDSFEEGVIAAKEWINDIIFNTSHYGVPYRLFSKETIKNKRFKEGYIYEDTFFMLDIIDNISKIGYTTKKLYYYRPTPGSITKSQFSEKHLDMISATENLLSFLQCHNYPTREIRKIEQDLCKRCCNFYIGALESDISTNNAIYQNLKNKQSAYIYSSIPSVLLLLQYGLPTAIFKHAYLALKKIKNICR